MTVAAIVATLAKDFSIQTEQAQAVFDLLASGSRVPYIARFRRGETGGLTEGTLRRFDRRRKQLEELERRRESLLRTLDAPDKGKPEESSESADALDATLSESLEDESLGQRGSLRESLESCMDRCILEDLFHASRRPEPEVQLALDRGLGKLAKELTLPASKSAPPLEPEAAPVEERAEAPEEEPAAESAEQPAEPEPASEPAAQPEEAAPPAETSAESEPAQQSEEPPQEAEAAEAEPTPGEEPPQEAEAAEAEPTPAAETPAEAETSEDEPAPEQAPAEPVPGKSEASRTHAPKIDFSPQLARLCAPYVNPDRGVHTERQAVEGAMRILADRLGRNPHVRSMIRNMVRRRGKLSVRPLIDEKKLGRNRSLLRLNTQIRQIQGHQLLSLRQAQIQRRVSASIEFDKNLVLPKVRSALGKKLNPDYASVVDAVVERAVVYRILPMIEEDMRRELRERADEEALRFLAQHLRQVLLAPVAWRRRVAGVDVNAKGDWTIVVVDENGVPMSSSVKIEVADKKPGGLADQLGNALRDSGTRSLVLGHGKGAREATHKLRECVHLLKADCQVYVTNEAGLGSYANSDFARKELPDHTVPERMAISLARRHQDPLVELLKTDIRHLGPGREQSVVSKANLRRILHDTVETCVAFVGCELNTASVHVLRHLPGLDADIARKIVERRQERPFESLEELVTEGILDETRWRNAAGFLRLRDSQEPLDRTGLHPEQYELARRIVEATGGSLEETLGRRDATKGLRMGDFDVDEGTWRDLLREISHPGRDPRQRVFVPQFLPPDLDPATLEKDQVVEGVVSNVASFGAFVDLGIPRDGMIHVSEISNRYVRDARGLLSIGQTVRARVLDGSGQRVELTLKGVPDLRRRGRREERPGRRQDRRRDGGDAAGGKSDTWPEYQPVVRAARSRRDGLAGSDDGRRSSQSRGRGRPGGGRPEGGRPGGGRPGGGRPPGRRGGDDRGERYDPRSVGTAPSAGSYSPFAAFFKDKQNQKIQKETAEPEKPDEAVEPEKPQEGQPPEPTPEVEPMQEPEQAAASPEPPEPPASPANDEEEKKAPE